MNLVRKISDFILLSLGKVHWRATKQLNEHQVAAIKGLLKDNYFVILTHRSNHLSSYTISLANFLLTGKFSYWSHALMNLEDEVKTDDDFRFVEAIGKGVTISPFSSVFDVDGLCLMKPKHMPLEDWTAVLDKAKSELGKPYDTLFDLASDKYLSCVELVRTALMAGDPLYHEHFANFEALISKDKNLTPEMYYTCGDFEPHLEIRL
jgi:hypothetical protein